MLKWMKRIGLGLLIIVALAVVALLATGNGHVLRGIRCTYLAGVQNPDIDDMRFFVVDTLSPGTPDPWPVHPRANSMEIAEADLAWSDSMGTTAFIVIKNDSIIYERYWGGTGPETVTNSFSMAKSVTAMLIGIAIDEGHIGSIDDRVGKYLPEFNSGTDSLLTIRNLLSMASGIPFGESYFNPFGFMAKAYFGKNLEEETMKYRTDRIPGSDWAYEGGNTVLLSLILKRTTGKTLTQYAEEKLWPRLGTEDEAYWNLDKEGGLEKSFSAIYATARDFARLGSLYLHDGVWKGDTIVPTAFVRESLTPSGIPDKNGLECTWYGLHWWLGDHEKGGKMYVCRGLRGQYVIALPEHNMIMVRIGHHQDKERLNYLPTDLYRYIDIALKL
ncbi:MAG: hypothetical protein RL220_1490 [Bacteroidota bacterium]